MIELKYVINRPAANKISTTTAVILVRSERAGNLNFT